MLDFLLCPVVKETVSIPDKCWSDFCCIQHCSPFFRFCQHICCRKLSVAPYQGAAREGCPARTGKSEAEHSNKAGRGLTDKGLTAPKQGKQRSSGKGNQLQLRIQNTNQVLDEAGPRSIQGDDHIEMYCPRSELRFGLMGYLLRYRHRHRHRHDFCPTAG